ncbi:MAG: succinate dehydrogenase cytochrome b subunit [Phycisphaerae bacterium]|jgi:succinate dehydrogenase / fumarate reductase, cytochrome b subunit|nr:succinate dehydrogenase cytochrome b subunit [Phycisphaerae bacterium]MBT5582422.1 succinate dehydrogenase cytochrome b subunit [Phycisphaerae bacterium]MBT5656425.1 succinate dehydrogenase cytochrome b subunit [Phycisphaerae bacterium]MBT7352176.1 succinate dehydrogenase cytochrome b subunit [Phycisphaerae bacterium]
MRVLKMYKTAIGKKAVVAITGVVLFLFLIAHMGGNLKVFGGERDIDTYAEHLRTLGEPIFGWADVLWIMRAVLLVCVLAHIVTVFLLVKQNKRARPQKYRHHHIQASTIASRLMQASGVVILVFVVLHILQFTTGNVQPAPVLFREQDGHLMAEVYVNLHAAFSLWWVAGLYVFAMACICVHLYHGAWSFLQTLGFDNQDRNRSFRIWAWLLSVGLFFGFSAVPFCFWTGILPPPSDVPSQTHPAQSPETH